MPSLALIFELCVDETFDTFEPSISSLSAQIAAAWCSYLEKHARRIYGMGISAAAIQAKTLAVHLQAGNLPDPFTARDVYLHHWAGLNSVKDVIEPLDLLESLGWIRSIPREQATGRPTADYLINPRIKEVKL
jgi:hypothetical protein